MLHKDFSSLGSFLGDFWHFWRRKLDFDTWYYGHFYMGKINLSQGTWLFLLCFLWYCDFNSGPLAC
jgi:hypothetical protein